MFELPDARRAVFWVAAAAIVVAQAAILRTASAYIHARVPGERRSSPWLEATWAIVPALALAVVLVLVGRRA